MQIFGFNQLVTLEQMNSEKLKTLSERFTQIEGDFVLELLDPLDRKKDAGNIYGACCTEVKDKSMILKLFTTQELENIRFGCAFSKFDERSTTTNRNKSDKPSVTYVNSMTLKTKLGDCMCTLQIERDLTGMLCSQHKFITLTHKKPDYRREYNIIARKKSGVY